MSTFRRPSNKPTAAPIAPPPPAIEQEWQPEVPQPGTLFGQSMPPSPAERWRVEWRNTRSSPFAPGRNVSEAWSDLTCSLAWSIFLIALSTRSATQLMADHATDSHALAWLFYALSAFCIIFPTRRFLFLIRAYSHRRAIRKANREHP